MILHGNLANGKSAVTLHQKMKIFEREWLCLIRIGRFESKNVYIMAGDTPFLFDENSSFGYIFHNKITDQGITSHKKFRQSMTLNPNWSHFQEATKD